MRRSQQGAMVVRQVSRCALWGHFRLRVMPVWFRCASGNRPGVCCAFCACYALHVSRFRPSSGGQHPIFRVLHAPVRVKEEPPDSPERHAAPEGAPDTETAAEGKMTDRTAKSKKCRGVGGLGRGRRVVGWGVPRVFLPAWGAESGMAGRRRVPGAAEFAACFAGFPSGSFSADKRFFSTRAGLVAS